MDENKISATPHVVFLQPSGTGSIGLNPVVLNLGTTSTPANNGTISTSANYRTTYNRALVITSHAINQLIQDQGKALKKLFPQSIYTTKEMPVSYFNAKCNELETTLYQWLNTVSEPKAVAPQSVCLTYHELNKLYETRWRCLVRSVQEQPLKEQLEKVQAEVKTLTDCNNTLKQENYHLKNDHLRLVSQNKEYARMLKTAKTRATRWRKIVWSKRRLEEERKFDIFREEIQDILKETLPDMAMAFLNKIGRQAVERNPVQYFSTHEQQFAATLYAYSPRAFKFMKHLFKTALPSVRTISNWNRQPKTIDSDKQGTNEGLNECLETERCKEHTVEEEGPAVVEDEESEVVAEETTIAEEEFAVINRRQIFEVDGQKIIIEILQSEVEILESDVEVQEYFEVEI